MHAYGEPVGRREAVAFGVTLLACSAVAVAVNAWVYLRGRARIVSPDEVTHADCAIVPGARIWAGDRPSHVLEDRLLTAVALLRAGKVARVMLSGAPDEVPVMRAFMIAHGVDAERLVLDEGGLTTWDTLVRARGEFHLSDVVVVSNAFHLPRALYACAALGLSAVGVSSDRRVYRRAAFNQAREAAARIKMFARVALHGRA